MAASADPSSSHRPHLSAERAHRLLTPELRADIINDFKPDHTAFRLFREATPVKAKAESKNRKYSCQCDPPVNVRATRELHATATTATVNSL
jgi:hypothetical protein